MNLHTKIHIYKMKSYALKRKIKRSLNIGVLLFVAATLVLSPFLLPIKQAAAAPILSIIAVSPGGSMNPPIQIGTSLQFTAQAIDQNLAPMVPQPVFTWASDNPAIGTIDANGLFSAIGTGTAIITASSGGINGTTTISVTNIPPVITYIMVGPNPLSLDINTTQQLTATAYDQYMVALATQPTFVWSSASSTLGSVSPTGLFTATGITGVITVTASSGAISGSVDISVTQPIQRVVADIFLTPSSFLDTPIQAGNTLQFTAQAVDQSLAPITPLPALTWTSSNPAVATVSPSGLVTGLTAGTSTITASAASGLTTIMSRPSPITVTAAVCQTGADANGDGKISMAELLGYIGKWKAGTATMTLLLKAIGFWKVGIGC